MTAASVARAAGRSSALRALVSIASESGWEVGLFDTLGHALAPSDGLPGLERLDVQMPLPNTLAHRSPVRSGDVDVGHVVVQPSRADAIGGWTLAIRIAAVLGDLCRLEVELVDLAREIAGAYEELNLFYDLSATLAGARDGEVVCRAVLERALRVVPARAARILLNDEVDGLRVVAQWGGAGDESGVGALSAARVCVESRQHVLLGLDAALGNSTQDEWEEAARHSLVAVPVRILTGDCAVVIGVLELRDRLDATDGRGTAFSAGDVKLVQALADQAALLLENTRLAAYEREVQLASHIQQGLLPAEPPKVEGLDIAAQCVAARDVGGDYYDFLEHADGTLSVLVADVSGHNLGAALLQTATRATFRAAALQGAGPARLLLTGNDALMDDLERAAHFLTVWAGRLDPRSGALEFESAGHPAALLLRAATGAIEYLTGAGLPVGIELDAEYVDHAERLDPGDVLLLHTDGLYEARDDAGEAFGEARLVASLRAAADGTAREIVDRVLADVRAHASVQSDDRTVVALKRSGGESR